MCHPCSGISHEANGAGTRTRTEDLLITNQLLYQLSYAGQAEDARGAQADLKVRLYDR